MIGPAGSQTSAGRPSSQQLRYHGGIVERRLLILPGMGATSAMYRGPWNDLANAEFVDWPKYGGEETLGDIAESIIEQTHATCRDVPIGSSLGGMVALEMAAQLGSPWCCLIGSARQPAEINGVLRTLAPLSSITPFRLTQVVASSAPSDLSRQFSEVDADFIRAACLAISRWRGSSYQGRVARIHGSKDLVIRCPDDTEQVAGAGHLVAYTHPRQTVEALLDFCVESTPEPVGS